MAPKMRRPAAAAAKVLPAAKVHPAVRPRVRKRPAAHLGPSKEEEAALKWSRGEITKFIDLNPRDLLAHPSIVVPKASYYLKEVKVAGKVTGLVLEDGASYVRFTLKGTTDDGLLQFQTGNPEKDFKMHICGSDCNQEEVGDTLLHAKEVRKMKGEDQEEGWTGNLIKVLPHQGEDELAALRRRGEGVALGSGAPEAEKDKPKKKEAKEKDKKKKKAKKKKKKEEKEVEEVEEEDDESETVAQDGSQAQLACVKSQKLLYSGTGMDPRERVRQKTQRRAKKFLKKKADKVSSSSAGGSSSSSPEEAEGGSADGLFGETSRIRTLAERFPGVLTAEAIRVMKESLVQEIGMETNSNRLMPVCVSYYRQTLARRASGPVSRELLSICTALDLLLKGRPSMASDLLMQRLKSVEQGLMGAHWTVAQRQEVLPQEHMSLTSTQEANKAQQELYKESKTRWTNSFPDGRVPRSANPQKGKSEKGPQKGGGKDRKDGKGKGAKNDWKNKKEGDKTGENWV